MRLISSFATLGELETAFESWFTDHFQPAFKAHSLNISKPIPRESMYWKDEMLNCSDALTFAKDLAPDAEDFQIQALGILTENFTVAEAMGKCHRVVRVHQALKRLAESADRRLSCLQSLNKN